MRSGQWCKFHIASATKLVLLGERKTAELGEQAEVVSAGCHKAVDGRSVGIYQAEGRDPVSGKETPAHICCVMPTSGLNLRFLHDGQAIQVCLAPDTVIDLAGIDYRTQEGANDVPRDRLFLNG